MSLPRTWASEPLLYLITLVSIFGCSCQVIDTSLQAGEVSAGEVSAGEVSAGEVGAGEVGAGEVIAGEVSAGEEITNAITTGGIYERLRPTCQPCHDANMSLPLFESLSRFQALLVANPAWIVPGHPEESAFIDLLNGRGVGNYRQMPPSGLPYSEAIAGEDGAPTMMELEEWIRGLDEGSTTPIDEGVECVQTPNRTVMTRLSKEEYRNAVKDLLGQTTDVATDLPDENESFGFAHIASLLTLSPLLIEKYDIVADTLSHEALPSHSPPAETWVFEAETDLTSNVGRESGEVWNLWANGLLSTFTTLPYTGTYEVSITVAGGQAGFDPVRFALVIDGLDIDFFETWAQNPDRETLSISLSLSGGEHQIGVRFMNDYYCPQENFDQGLCAGVGDRNLLVDRLIVHGPASVTVPPSDFETRFLTCTPTPETAESCARAVINRFGRLAWRRGLEEAEVDRLWRLVENELNEDDLENSWRDGLRLTLHAILLSPHFIFRVETTAQGQTLSAYERATRLAALIWRSIPDEALLSEAEAGRLDTDEGLTEQVDRMLQDPKAHALILDFGGRWFQLHHLDSAAPDYARFPDFDESLRVSMRRETERVLETIVVENRSILDLLDADFTWIDQRLASHYGLLDLIDLSQPEVMQRVSLPQGGRLGLLTHGSWLTHTSHPTRTSPVVRGKWVLENLLCRPPPPPPPSVEGLPESGVDQNASLRQRFEQHRADPACEACHTHMDAIGFGLEQFDGVGAFRLVDGNEVIDPSGELPTSPPTSFSSTIELIRALRADPALPQCVTERFVIYALGRGVGEEERCLLSDVQQDAGLLSLQSLTHAIVKSVLMSTSGEER